MIRLLCLKDGMLQQKPKLRFTMHQKHQHMIKNQKPSHVSHGEVFALLPAQPSRAWLHKTKKATAERCAVPLILIPDHTKFTFVRKIKQKVELICYRVAHVGTHVHFCFVCFSFICLRRKRFHQISLWQIDQRQWASLFRANLGDRWPVAPFG